jgi:hypothetical protein
MNFTTAIEYLGVGETTGRKILDNIPSFQHFTGDPERDSRGNRYWRRSTIDAYLEDREKVAVTARAA